MLTEGDMQATNSIILTDKMILGSGQNWLNLV